MILIWLGMGEFSGNIRSLYIATFYFLSFRISLNFLLKTKFLKHVTLKIGVL